MTDLTPICALGAATPRSLRAGDLTLTENADLGLASLALPKGAPHPAGLTLPGPGAWQQSGEIAAFWTGPDQWLTEWPGAAAQDVTALLGARVQNGRITEQTDAFVCIDITGPAPSLLALMERLVNLNPQRFAPGSATRTGLHHMAVFVIRRAEDQLAVMGMRSAAGSLWHALAVAAERQAQR